jgi:chromosomal replication initiator protein
MGEILVSKDLAEQAWLQCLDIIREKISDQKFTSWFKPIKPVKLEDQVLTIQVPSQFWYEWLEEHYYGLLRSTLGQIIGPSAKLDYAIVIERNVNTELNKSVTLPQSSMPTLAPQEVQGYSRYAPYQVDNPFVIPGIQKPKVSSGLNKSYVFDRFIEGDCNRLALNAGRAIAKKPGNNSFNPLFIYGGTGLGKTHLIQSIGNEVKKMYGDTKSVLYKSSEAFTNEYVQAIRNNKASEFTMFYRNIDVLIIDDIQFFSGKEKTQEEFFHIFNALHQEGKQIILTSDRAPKDVPDIQDRLISRFSWGLSADLQLPDFETRYAILERKATDNGIELDPQVLEFIARNLKSNIRDLEGAIIRLLATASLQDIEHIDVHASKVILKDMVRETKAKISIESIQELVCDYFNIPTNKVKDKTRKQEIVEARQIAMFLAKKFTESSLKTIGLHFGGRDHSTVIHAVRTIENLLENNPKYDRILKELEQKIELSSL